MMLELYVSAEIDIQFITETKETRSELSKPMKAMYHKRLLQ